jgi:hypothetical protein
VIGFVAPLAIKIVPKLIVQTGNKNVSFSFIEYKSSEKRIVFIFPQIHLLDCH